MLLVSLYTFIGLYYLKEAPVNSIVQLSGLDARGLYYAWFVISIFTLEWARSALSNVQAAALMYPSLAPRSAMHLLWHGDDNWANFLRWLRGIRNVLSNFLPWRHCYGKPQYLETRPGSLWCFLSSNSLLVFIAVPLSGLNVELTTVLAPSLCRTEILGTTPESFPFKGVINIPQIIRGRRKAGGQTRPTDMSYFYATEGTLNALITYYQTEIQSPEKKYVQTFLPPAVNEVVKGTVWGMLSNVSCYVVMLDQLLIVDASNPWARSAQLAQKKTSFLS